LWLNLSNYVKNRRWNGDEDLGSRKHNIVFDWIFKGLYNAYFGRYATLLKYWGDGLFKAFRNTKEKRTTCLGE
jgi:hypothetical protein